jgi:transcriptional regulator with XRE-family HTH domain
VAWSGDRVRSGIADLDELLDGLILGDNVVLVTEELDLARRLEDGLFREALDRGQPCFYVSARSDLARVRDRLPRAVTVLDARPRGDFADPGRLETTLVEGSRASPPGCVVVDGLAAFSRRWGTDRAVRFFSRVCPRLFDLGALAYWRASREELGRSAIERITKVTQCVLELGPDSLRVVKAEGRPASVQGRLLRLRIEDQAVILEDERALGRLGRGLEQLRRQRKLSQTDLARMGGVSPSAISQAEGGRRGLSLDTLLTLADSLGVGLDELLASAPLPGYVLGRHRRGSAEACTALIDDPKAGLRAYLVRLEAGASAQPDQLHKGLELVAVAAGLVQVTIGADTPVMRAGDVALATREAVTEWRNLVSEPALIFWILRD